MARISYVDPATIKDAQALQWLEEAVAEGRPGPENQAIRAHQPDVMRSFTLTRKMLFDGDAGVLELGATDHMEAVAEVYESDVNRVRVGQEVTLISENGGFSGQLNARVLRISPQVRQRAVLSTDPTGDADARVVEVRLALDPDAAARVQDLAGLKVIARFTP